MARGTMKLIGVGNSGLYASTTRHRSLDVSHLALVRGYWELASPKVNFQTSECWVTWHSPSGFAASVNAHFILEAAQSSCRWGFSGFEVAFTLLPNSFVLFAVKFLSWVVAMSEQVG